MRALSSTYGSRGGVEPMAGLVAAKFDTVAAAAEECDAIVIGVMPTGEWR